MNSKDILRAVQEGKIKPEDVKQELIKAMKCEQEETNREPVVKVHEAAPGVAQVTMQDRLYKNAFSEELASGLIAAFKSIQDDPKYKVVILTGYDSYFASGGTKERLLDIHEGKVKYTDTNIYWLALECKLPVIAAMNGHAFGAGWCMGMFCDFIVMSRESVYSANFMKFGFTPGAGSTLIFPEKFGTDLGQEILFTGNKYHGSEFSERGVSFKILPQKDVLPWVLELSKTLAESSREALLVLKEHMTDSIRKRLPETIEKELGMHGKTFLHKQEVKDRIQSSYGQLSNTHNLQDTQNTISTSGIPVTQPVSSYTSSVNSPDTLLHEPIAIIGMSGQFPKAKNLEQFWDNLAGGLDCISEISTERWPIDEYYDPDPKAPGKTYCKWGGILEDADKFDPLFFNISPAEAELMDPQQRLFLESSWHCFEDAGLNAASVSGSRCGVFVGCGQGDYNQLIGDKGMNAQGLMGSSISILAGRISYLLNLLGPCIAIDTACSSSLVALVEACKSLTLKTIDMALAGGVCSFAGPSMHVMSSKAGMLSKDGKCFTFDARANGFVPGEGVGVVLLKRLSDAIRDRDPICGVIKGWGTNQDGKTNGITAPSVGSQILLEEGVYQSFGINPETITMIEAHGTGTKLGDPIEVEALTEAFQSFTYKKNYCALGSVKSNIGHLSAAAGIAGLFKVLLALKHKLLPPTINFETLNEHISLDKSPFYINTKLKPWETPSGTPRRAGVNSFGFSGTNAHVVIEEYVPYASAPAAINQSNPILFVLSAKCEERLKAYAESMKSFVEAHKDLDLADMAYTLQTGREAMEYRLAFLSHSGEGVVKALEGFICGSKDEEVLINEVIKGKNGRRGIEKGQNAKGISHSGNQRDRLKEAAESWVKGLKTDWNKLYGEVKPCRINIPVYPFARERYWITEFTSINKAAVSTASDSLELQAEQGKGCEGCTQASIEAELIKAVSKILGMPKDKIDSNYELTRYGFDSISGMTLIDCIKNLYGIKLEPQIVFEYNSVSELTQYLMKEKGLKEEQGEKSFPLSVAQNGLWLIDQLAPGSYAYNLPSAFVIRKKIDVKALEEAFREIVLRHPLLSARIRLEGEQPVHMMGAEGKFLFEAEDIKSSAADFKDYLMEKVHEPFDLENGPLTRIHLFSSAQEEHVLLINIHHIVFDGSSLPLMLKELLQLYSAKLSGKKPVLPQPEKSYADFVSWQSKYLSNDEGRKDGEYWQQKLSGELPVLDLPMCTPKAGASDFKGVTYVREISKELSESIQNLSADEKVSPFVLMLSAFKALLHRYTNQEDIVIGTAAHGRSGSQCENVIGYFTNMVLIRTCVSGELTFSSLLKEVRENVFEALEHSNYPFSEIVKEKKGIRNRGNSPIIQVAFVFHNWLKNIDQLFLSDKGEESNNLLTLEPIPEIHQEGEFDISLEVIKGENNYSLFFKYNPELFDSKSIDVMAEHYTKLLDSITQNSRQNISQIDFLTTEERRKLLTEWVDTKKDYIKDKCIHQLFEEQVRKSPDDTAVIFKDQTLTYSGLNKKANLLARYLRSKGVKPNSVVGIMVERSLEMPIGLFGILKSGGAYMPIDPEYPKDRVKYMLKDSGANILLVQSSTKRDIEFDGEIIDISEEIRGIEDADPECINKSGDMVYVIYTSGSTGNPKGAMVEHHSLVNKLKWRQKAYPLGKDDIIMQKTPYTFDVSVWEQFWWALEGAKVCFLPPKAEKDPQAIIETIEKNKVTIIHFVPSMLGIFLEYIKGCASIANLTGLKRVFASGEALTVPQVKLFNETLYAANGTTLSNLYGPTEATIEVSYFDCSTGGEFDRIPIGKPIDNVKLFVVNKANMPQPIGIPGELCIAGVCLSRGYLNNQQLTREKFVDNPFDQGEKMYRTGDLTRWNSDGNIEYLGRIDRQIKIRGFRIELGEIEAALSSHEGIQEACVTVDREKDMSGNSRLKAYVVAKGEQDVSSEVLRSYLKKKLPDYMIPSAFVQLAYLPLTAHGKVDVKALSELHDKKPEKAVLSKGTNEDIKSIITSIYKEMLQLDEIDTSANFFDLGGHSMLLVKAVIKLRDVLKREVTTVDIFQYATIDSLAEYLSRDNKQETAAGPKKEVFEKSRRKAARQRDILKKLNPSN